MVAQDRRPRRNGALSAIVAMTGSSRLLLVSPRTMPSPNLIWGAAELTDILNEIGGTRISRSQVCRLVTNGDLPKRRQVGKVAYSKRAIRVHVARITVDGSMIQPDARARATWVIGGTGNLGGNS
jgi:hypothetical protein